MKKIKDNETKVLREEIKKCKKSGNTTLLIRLKVLLAYLNNKPTQKIAEYFDVTQRTVKDWIKRYEQNGIEELIDKPRSGRPPKLNKEELDELKSRIAADNERVWVARHIYQLIVTVFSVIYSVKYLPELLRKLDLSFHKAIHYLVKKNEEKREKWIKEKLPKLYKDHIEEGWRIFFQDEVGFQTEGTLAYTWGPKGEKTEVKNYGRHGRVNLMGVYEVGSGEFFYKLTTLKVNALRFKRFLCCLKKQLRTDKILIIADNASFHKAKWFTAWWKDSTWLRLEFLPAYSPDFNPIERLWKWIKREYTHNKCWSSKWDLKKYLIKSLKKMPDRTQDYIGTMRNELLRLKSAFEHYEVPFIWNEYLPQEEK